MHYTATLRDLFEKNSDSTNALKMKQYMRNQYDFFGIKAPERRQILASFFKENGYPDDIPAKARQWWEEPEREFQYSAMEMMERRKKYSTIRWIETYEFMVINKSWWDTVDFISLKLVGYHFKNWPAAIREYIPRWMDSGNIWLQRACLLFQLKDKKETDWDLLKELIVKLKDSEEFFIRKAIGWILREYSKTYPERVKDFVEEASITGLSRREALR